MVNFGGNAGASTQEPHCTGDIVVDGVVPVQHEQKVHTDKVTRFLILVLAVVHCSYIKYNHRNSGNEIVLPLSSLCDQLVTGVGYSYFRLTAFQCC